MNDTRRVYVPNGTKEKFSSFTEMLKKHPEISDSKEQPPYRAMLLSEYEEYVKTGKTPDKIVGSDDRTWETLGSE